MAPHAPKSDKTTSVMQKTYGKKRKPFLCSNQSVITPNIAPYGTLIARIYRHHQDVSDISPYQLTRCPPCRACKK